MPTRFNVPKTCDKPVVPPLWTPEIEAECERVIAAIYAARRQLGTVGDNYPDTDSTSADD